MLREYVRIIDKGNMLLSVHKEAARKVTENKQSYHKVAADLDVSNSFFMHLCNDFLYNTS